MIRRPTVGQRVAPSITLAPRTVPTGQAGTIVALLRVGTVAVEWDGSRGWADTGVPAADLVAL